MQAFTKTRKDIGVRQTYQSGLEIEAGARSKFISEKRPRGLINSTLPDFSGGQRQRSQWISSTWLTSCASEKLTTMISLQVSHVVCEFSLLIEHKHQGQIESPISATMEPPTNVNATQSIINLPTLVAAHCKAHSDTGRAHNFAQIGPVAAKAPISLRKKTIFPT